MRLSTVAAALLVITACDAAAQDGGRQTPHEAHESHETRAPDPRDAAPPAGTPAAQALEADLARIRATTERFHNPAAAAAAGYTPTDHCVESLSGGMGHHFVNAELLDDRLQVDRPEILVYAPEPGGGLRLVGVEYAVPYSAWQRSEPPRILGRDLKQSDGLRLWYLHVWVWRSNPNGVFADWNPRVRCTDPDHG